jgi:prepilin-type N-terminal cleavage/methylation domain-containing protein
MMNKNILKTGSSGFTLIEVVAAVAILMLFLTPILGAVSQGLRSVNTARSRAVALQLGQDKMTEIEMLPFPEFEGIEDGDFGKEHPDFTWEVETVKSPEIILIEELFKMKGMTVHLMEVHVRVFWDEGSARKSVQLYTLLLEG